MRDPEKSEGPTSLETPSTPVQNAPFEAQLTQAFNKLTSEIFIFLLAYVILLIGLAVFGAQVADTLRNLLYIIPLLGVIAYTWLQRKNIAKAAEAKGINVKAGVVIGGRIVGVRGAQPESRLPDNVEVRVGLAGKQAEVGGVVYGQTEPDAVQNTNLEALKQIFTQLDQSNQIKLINSAQNLLNKQDKTNA